jgi:hypothetical protein
MIQYEYTVCNKKIDKHLLGYACLGGVYHVLPLSCFYTRNRHNGESIFFLKGG